MENYKKGKNIEEELSQDRIPIENLPEKFLWMHVKGGTKVHNVLEFAEKALNTDEHRAVVWSGSGGGVPKTISCAEIMKRKFELHQVTRLNYQKIEEYWDPIMSGLEPIVVSRQVPAIHILLSLDEIDSKTSSYQRSSLQTSFWAESSAPSRQSKKSEDYVYRNRNQRNAINKSQSQQHNRPKGRSQNGQQTVSQSSGSKNQNKKKPKDEPAQPILTPSSSQT